MLHTLSMLTREKAKKAMLCKVIFIIVSNEFPNSTELWAKQKSFYCEEILFAMELPRRNYTDIGTWTALVRKLIFLVDARERSL
jgi:hypothetical protein